MSKLILFILICSLFILSSCSDSYQSYKSDCLRYDRNCIINGTVCIPKCTIKNICSKEDFKYCNDKFIKQNGN